MLESNAASIAARLSTPDRLFFALIGKNYRAIKFGWSNETKRVVAFCVAECVCNYGECVWHLRNNKPSLWNHQKTIRSRRFFVPWFEVMLMKPTKSSGRKRCKTALNCTLLHFRNERWPCWLNCEHDNSRGSLYLLVFVCLLYTFLLTDFPLLSYNAVRDDSRTKHNTQLHTWQPSFFGIWRRTFFVFFCVFFAGCNLLKHWTETFWQRHTEEVEQRHTKYVDHFIIYWKNSININLTQ